MNAPRETCWWAQLVLLGFSFLLFGCIDSEAPLSSPDQSPLDEKLIGKWNGGDSQITFAKVVADGFPPGIILLTLDDPAKPDDQRKNCRLGFSTALKGKTYFNLIEEDWDGGPKLIDGPLKLPPWKTMPLNRFTILKYAVKEDTLTFWAVDDESPLKTAVQNGKLKGTIRKRGPFFDYGPTVQLKDTTANVVQFLLSEDEKLFSKPAPGKFLRGK